MDIKRSALIIMDYQNGILKMVESEAPALLGRAKKILTTARAANLPVFFVRVAFLPGHPEVSPNNLGFSMAKAGGRFLLGTPDAEIHIDVAPLVDEPLITKHRISPLPDTDLATHLRARDVNHLILMGISTSGCVLSTVRIAADQDYRLTVIDDACADPDPEVHALLMRKVFPRQSKVISTEAFLAGFEKSAASKS